MAGTPPTYSIAPDDLAIIFDIMPLYNSGIDGTGQTVVVVGQSDLEYGHTDIANFRTQFNLPGKDPKEVLYGPDPGITGALEEADLDIEWVSAVARNASIVYVNSSDFLLSSIYAVDQNLGSVITASYGFCESEAFYLADMFQSVVQQANAQGTTYLAAAGDAGASECDNFDQSPLATNGLAVSFPAGIPEVTAVGGTEFNEGSGTYWSNTNTANGASALSYIPEMAWNDSALSGTILAGGGGPSILFQKPLWQTGPGVPDDHARDTPDVAMPASNFHDGFWECTLFTCDTFGGGTSVATPVTAGLVALANQWVVSKGLQSQPGLGNINPLLYRLAQSSNKIFHDIVEGNAMVPCASGTPDCTNGTLGFAAAPGYDMATGLGSIDAANLIHAWTIASAETTTSVQVDNSDILMSGSVQLAINVAAADGRGTPTGSVSVFLSDTSNPVTSQTSALPLGTATLSGGSATLIIYGGQLEAGTNAITIDYGGDSQFSGSSAVASVKATLPTSNSAESLSVYPYNYYDGFLYPPVGQTSAGSGWSIHIRLKELAGTATAITGLTVNGTDLSSQIKQLFGTTSLAANGALQAIYTLTNVVSAPSTIIVGMSGHDASGFQWTTELQVPLSAGTDQFVQVNELTNAASFYGSFAPGMIMSVFGGSLTTSNTTAQAGALPLPLTLAGSRATINGVSAPYYYASYGQVNIQIPYETAPGNAVLRIEGFAGQTFEYSFPVTASAPGIFTDPMTLAPVPSETATAGGGAVTLYITGEGLVAPALATGASPAAGTPLDQYPKPTLPVSMTVGGEPAEIVFIGITPGIVGATQINYVVSSKTPSGIQPVIVTVGGVPSPPAWITIQ